MLGNKFSDSSSKRMWSETPTCRGASCECSLTVGCRKISLGIYAKTCAPYALYVLNGTPLTSPCLVLSANLDHVLGQHTCFFFGICKLAPYSLMTHAATISIKMLFYGKLLLCLIFIVIFKTLTLLFQSILKKIIPIYFQKWLTMKAEVPDNINFKIVNHD